MTTPERQRRRTRILIALQGVSALVAVVALVTVLVLNNQSRTRGREDFCLAMVHVFQKLTPPGKAAQLQIALKETGLNNCNAFARSLK